MTKSRKPRPGDPFFTVNRIRKVTRMTDKIDPREPSLPNDVPALRELMDKLTTDYHAAMQPLIDQMAKINAMRAPAPVQARQCAKCGTIYAPELGGCYNCKPHRADHDGTFGTT